jgi:hypothetical protein
VNGDGTAVYLYGVTRGLDPRLLDGAAGVDAAPVRAVTAAGLTALVSTARLDRYGEHALRANLEDLRFVEDTARAHHDVVDLAARAAPTAPVRIATLYRDDDRVRQILTERHDHFTRILDAITGRTEWGVKAYAHPDRSPAADDPPADPPADPPGGGAGTAYLRRRQQQRRHEQDTARHLAAQAETLHTELAAHCAAARHHPPQDPRLSGRHGTLVLNAAYLVDDDRSETFLATARAAAAREAAVEVEVTGPWPPYSFIDTFTGARTPTGAGP